MAKRFKRTLGLSDRPHTVMDAARTEAALGNLETAALAKQHVLLGYPHVGELHLTMTMRRIVIAENRQRPHDINSRCFHRNQDHRLLAIRFGIGISLTHKDKDFAARITGSGDPPFVAVDDPFIALALGKGLHREPATPLLHTDR